MAEREYTLPQINDYNRAAGFAPWSLGDWERDRKACIRITKRRVREAARRQRRRDADDFSNLQKLHIPTVKKGGRVTKNIE